MCSRLKVSRKKPGLQYWFYAGGEEEKTDRDKDGITDGIDDAKDIMALLQKKNVALPGGIVYKEAKNGRHNHNSRSAEFPGFLLWAFGN